MRNASTMAFALVFSLALTMSASQAFAECENPYMQQAADRLAKHAELAKESQGMPQITESIMTSQKILDRAPMSEDFGPEIVGPYTFSEIYRGYLDQVEADGRALAPSVIDHDVMTMNRLCDGLKGMPKNGDQTDIIELLQKFEKTGTTRQQSHDPWGVVASLTGLLLLAGTFAEIWRARKMPESSPVPEAPSNITPLRPVPPKKSSDDDEGEGRSAA